MALRHYAQRLLNPFRGVMNIIEFEAAEAVTTDGIHWDIYVRDAELVKDMPNSRRVQTSDIRYGSWSAQQGLKRGAIYPSDDFMYLEHMGAIVYQHLLKLHQDIPFPLQDHFELWLLDRQQQPLALIASSTQPDNMETDLAIDWRAGQACRQHFSSQVYEQQLTDKRCSAGTYLTRYVNSLAHTTPMAQWFRRSAQGDGEGLQGINLPGDLVGRQLNEACFHSLLLNRDEHDPVHRALIEEFLDWQAPWILLLQHLTDRQRSYYEKQARQRALTVEQQYNLYPRILDPAQINAARVEARLRNSQASRPHGEEVMSPHYIELCPDPTLES
jgi:hypothetical protein